MILTKICMPSWRCLPSLGSNVVDGIGTLGLKGGALCWRWASCPGKGLTGGVHLALLLFVSMVLALFWLPCGFASSAPLGMAVGAALTARAQVKGYKREPLLLCTDRSPRAWAIHKRDALLG